MANMQVDRKKISANIAPASYAFFEQLMASHRAGNIGEAIDLAVEEMRRAEHRERSEQAAPYPPEPSAEEVAQDRATLRTMRDSNPGLLFDE